MHVRAADDASPLAAAAARRRPFLAGGRDYGAPGYSSPSHEDEQAHATSDSTKPHPRGAADTSGMNSPAGRAGGEQQAQEQQQQPQEQQQQPQEHQGAGAQQAASDAERLDGGAAGGIAGAWRAMTADFAAGGEDLTGGNATGTLADDAGMVTPVNPASGLPMSEQIAHGDASEAGSGFGRLRPPGESAEQGETARQFVCSTGQAPADLSSS